MKALRSFLKRNMKLYFRDKAALILSFLTLIIIILLFALFLYDLNMPKALEGHAEAGFYLNSWLIAGMVAVASVTTTLGAFGVMVDDKTKKLYKDFYTAPISRASVTAGYILNAAIIGLLMSFLTLLFGEIYILIFGGKLLSFGEFVKVFGIIVLSSLSNTALLSFIISFVKTSNVFSTLSILIGTLVGFIAGVYIPIGMLPQGVQYFMKIFPFTHSAALLRQVFMTAPMTAIFEGAPEELIAANKASMGTSLNLGDYVMPAWLSVVYLIVVIVLFFSLTVYNLSRKKK